jgi:hypothetical protein
VGRNGGSADQTGESRREKQCIELVLHHFFDLVWGVEGG